MDVEQGPVGIENISAGVNHLELLGGYHGDKGRAGETIGRCEELR
jgi:hypothetical protein